MKTTSWLWVLALALQGSAWGQEGAEAESQAEPAFGWQVPCTATVTQEGAKRGNQVTMRYQIRLVEDGDALRLTTDRLELIAVNGVDMTAPELEQAAAAQAAQLQTAFPVLRISKQGELLGVEDWEAHVDRCLETLRAVGKADDEGLAATRRIMLDPRYRAQLELKSGEHWQVWVTAWQGVDVPAGESEEWVTEIPIGEAVVEAPVTVTHEGTGADGRVRMRMETLLQGDAAKDAMRRMLLDMSRDGPNPMPADLQIKDFLRKTTLTVTAEPETLRPVEASTTALNRVEVGDEGAQERQEWTRYRFEWE